jgi:hypothetical protein
MNHLLQTYPEVEEYTKLVSEQMNDNIIVLMETKFDNNLDEVDHKKRAKIVKAFNRSIKEVTPVSQLVYPMQVQMMKIRINLEFLLECAHNKISYKALAQDFAEYDFTSQRIKKEIKKEANKTKNEALTDFLEKSTCLDFNFFDMLMTTVKQMQENIILRMEKFPEQYIDLDIEVDSHLDLDLVKNVFKDEISKLKQG